MVELVYTNPEIEIYFGMTADQVAFMAEVVADPTDADIAAMFAQREDEIEAVIRYALLAA